MVQFINNGSFVCMEQLCPTHGPQATCGPVVGFVQPSLGFHWSINILYTDNLSFLW